MLLLLHFSCYFCRNINLLFLKKLKFLFEILSQWWYLLQERIFNFFTKLVIHCKSFIFLKLGWFKIIIRALHGLLLFIKSRGVFGCWVTHTFLLRTHLIRIHIFYNAHFSFFSCWKRYIHTTSVITPPSLYRLLLQRLFNWRISSWTYLTWK